MSHDVHQEACAIKPTITVNPKIVSVNGIRIPLSAIARETQNHPSAKPIEAIRSAARALVIRELLLQEARRLDFSPAPLSDDTGLRETDEEALIRQVLEHEVTTPEPDEAACRRYYVGNISRFRTPDLFEVSHILIPAGEGAEMTAVELLRQLSRDPSSFGTLAAAHSACPSRIDGGRLGQIGPGETTPEFEAALPTLPVGTVVPAAVASRYGLHIVKVDRRIPGKVLPFELVSSSIADFLGHRVRHVAERQYVQILASRAHIVGVDFEMPCGPLVQ